MYYIRKSAQNWAVHNNVTGKRRELTDAEVHNLFQEFPNLKFNSFLSRTVTYFRIRIRSIPDLP